MVKRFTGYGDDPVSVARRLLGQRLVRMDRGRRLAGTIIETEAYLGAIDEAAHTFGGRRTPRVESMYLPGGFAYVYLTYGIHYCMNAVCGEKDDGVAVLLRAIEPTEGLDVMRARRLKARHDRQLCAGPGRLTQALDVDTALDGASLVDGDVLFVEQARLRTLPDRSIVSCARVGVESCGDWAGKPLRFLIRDHPGVSRPPARHENC